MNHIFTYQYHHVMEYIQLHVLLYKLLKLVKDYYNIILSKKNKQIKKKKFRRGTTE